MSTRAQFVERAMAQGLGDAEIAEAMKRRRATVGAFDDDAPASAKSAKRPNLPDERARRNQMFSEYGGEYATYPTATERQAAGQPVRARDYLKDAFSAPGRLLAASTFTPVQYAWSKLPKGEAPPAARLAREYAPADMTVAPGARPPATEDVAPPLPPPDPDAYDPGDSFYGNFLHNLRGGAGSGVAQDPSLPFMFATGGPTAQAAERLVQGAARHIPAMVPRLPGVGRGAQLGAEGALQGVQQAGINRGLGDEQDYLPALTMGAAGNILIGGAPYALGSVLRFLAKGAEPTVSALRPLATPGEVPPEALRPDAEFGIQLSPAQVMGERGGPRAAAEMTVQTDPLLGGYPRALKGRNLEAMNQAALEQRQAMAPGAENLDDLLEAPETRGRQVQAAARGAEKRIGRTFGEGVEEIENQPGVAPDLGPQREAVKGELTAQGLAPEDVKTSMRLQEGAGGRDLYRDYNVSRETKAPKQGAQARELAQRDGTLFQGEEELPAEWEVTNIGEDFAEEAAGAGGVPEPWGVMDSEGGDIIATGATREEAVQRALQEPDVRARRRPSLPEGYRLVEDPAQPDPGRRWQIRSGNDDRIEAWGATRENVIVRAQESGLLPDWEIDDGIRMPEGDEGVRERLRQLNGGDTDVPPEGADPMAMHEGLPGGFQVTRQDVAGQETWIVRNAEGRAVNFGRTYDEAVNNARGGQRELPAGGERRGLPAPEAPPKPKPFYSNTMKFLEGVKQEAWGSGQDLSNFLKGKPGIKEEEIKWTGLDLWLEGQKGKVSKADVVKFLDENQVRLEEVSTTAHDFAPTDPFYEMENGPGPGGEVWKSSDDGLTGTYVDEKNNIHWTVDTGRGEITAVLQDVAAHGANKSKRVFRGNSTMEIENKIRAAHPDKFPSLEQNARSNRGFKEYSMPGGKNYTEAKLILPRGQFGDRAARFGDYLRQKHGINKPVEPWEKRYAKFLGLQEGAEPYRSGHYNEKDIAAHVRYQETVHDGKKAILWDEGQSDWANRGRESGYLSLEEIAAAEKKVAEAYRAEADRIEAGDGTLSEPAFGPDDVRKQEKRRLESMAPDMPFKSNWPELTFKAMLRKAAESGADYLMWPVGKYQAERYGRAAEGENASGLVDLYDKVIPKYVAKYIKKWGAKLERQTWDPGLDPDYMSVVDETRLQKHGGPGALMEEGGFEVWAVPVTDEMRASVMEGQPLFQKPKQGEIKGSYASKGRKVTLYPQGDFSTVQHENAHDIRAKILKKSDEKPFTDWMEAQGITVLGKNGRWTKKAEEAFARAVESMLFEGKIPGPKEIQAPLARAAVSMRKLYEKGDLPEVTPEMREALAKTLTPKEILKNYKMGVTQVPKGPGEIEVTNELQARLGKLLEGAGVKEGQTGAASTMTPKEVAFMRDWQEKAGEAKTFEELNNWKRNFGQAYFEGQKEGAFARGRGDVVLAAGYNAAKETGADMIRREFPKEMHDELVGAWEKIHQQYSEGRKVLTMLGDDIDYASREFKPAKAAFYTAFEQKAPEALKALKARAEVDPDLKPLWEASQAAFIDGYLGKSITTAGTSPNIFRLSPAKLQANWGKIPKETKELFFDDGGAKWDRFMGRLSKMGIADADLFNPSGTARLQESTAFLKKLFSPSEWSRTFAENYVKKLLVPRIERYYTEGAAGDLGSAFDIIDGMKAYGKGLQSRKARVLGSAAGVEYGREVFPREEEER